MHLYFEWDWAAAEKACRRAIELNPGYPDAHQTLADLLLVMERREEAAAALARALELDPLNFWMQMAVGGRLLRLGRWEEGMTHLSRSLETEPNLALARRYLWVAYHHAGRDEEAAAEATSYFDLLGWTEVAEALAGGIGRSGYAGAMLEAAAALEARAARSFVQGPLLAALYAYGGRKDRALDWLERAHAERDTWLVFVMDDPRFETLRSEPRFRRLLDAMALPYRGVPS
jgi:tetratricopeptide (TPR) repeat protein